MDRITLKNIKHHAGLSQETHAYTATVYFDGKKVGTTKNAGHGGCDLYRPTDKALNEQMAAYIKGLPAVETDIITGGKPWMMTQTLETICCDLVNAYLGEKELKTKLRSAILYVDGDADGVYRVPLKQRGKKWTVEEVAAAITKKNPSARILNTMPFGEALKLWAA